jgi:outer membrane immunogenic protein
MRHKSADRVLGDVMKKQLLLGVAFGALALSSPALAADLPVKAPIYKSAPLPVYNWTGCYVGGNVGYSWGRSSGEFDFPGLSSSSFITPPLAASYPISSNPQGVIGGVQVGCNRQIDNRWVLGVEADIQGSAQKASRNISAFNTFGEGFSGNVESRLRWFGTLRGVAGFLVTPTVMLYGTGGLAYGDASISSAIAVTPFGNATTNVTAVSSSATKVGYAVGAGIAGAFPNSNNWTWKLEYLYIDLGSLGAAGTDPVIGPYNFSAKITDNILRVGVNYRFGDWGMAPVVAKY